MVILALFFEAKTTKKREKMMLNHVFFLNIDFQLLFHGFLRFGDDLGRPRTLQKSQKIVKNRFRGAFGVSSRIQYDLGSNFDQSLAIWIDFWTILEAFWKNFGETYSLLNGFCRTYFDD